MDANCPKCGDGYDVIGPDGYTCYGCNMTYPRETREPVLNSVGAYERGGGEFQPGPVLVSLSNIQREEVCWLWDGRLARGRLTCLMGDPGVGKSWLTLAVATAITTGAGLPGQEAGRVSGSVLLLTAEDGLADTVRPRMEDMGADLSRVTILTATRDDKGRERHVSLSDDLASLELALLEGGYSLVVIDRSTPT